MDRIEKCVFDLEDDTTVKFTGKEDVTGFLFSNVNLTRFAGFSRAQFLSLGEMTQSKGPKIALYGDEKLPDCAESDMSEIIGMTPRQFIANLERLKGCKIGYMNFTGNESLDGADLSGMNLANVANMSIEHYRQAKSIRNVVYSKMLIGMDDDVEGMDFTDSDLTNVIISDTSVLSYAASLTGTILPPGKYGDLILKDKKCQGTNFSQCREMKWYNFREADDLSDAVMPPFHMRQEDLFDDLGCKIPINPCLDGADFRLVTGISQKMADRLSQLGAVNATVWVNPHENARSYCTESERQPINAGARLIAEIICPGKNRKRNDYVFPKGMNGLAMKISHYCHKKKLDRTEFARSIRLSLEEPFAAEEDVVREAGILFGRIESGRSEIREGRVVEAPRPPLR